jgi:TldD protein
MNERSAAWEALAPVALDNMRVWGTEYADIRIQVHRQQDIYARNDRIASLEDQEKQGLGVRALVGGTWGFAASARLTPEAIVETAQRAVEMGRAASAIGGRKVELAPEQRHAVEYHTPRTLDPFEVPMAEKTGLLLECARLMREVPEIKEAWALIRLLRQDQLFLSTEGSHIRRSRIVPHAMLIARAVGNGDVQTRTYDTWARHSGWEFILQADLPGNAPRVAREAKEKLFAAEAPEGLYDLILDPEHLALTMHESIGHATELDRVLGYEADFAGTSFATTEKLGNFRYGSRHVNIVADNTNPEYIASLGCDDEGVAGQRWDIIRDGILTGYSTGREFAGAIGEERSRGSCRAEGWWAPPIVRIPNLGLEPGRGRLEDLIADTTDGILIEGRGTFSIDQRRLDFQFGGDMFWRIQGGRRTSLLKNVVYRSRTPVFWNACDAVCGPEEFRALGLPNCGKGQPVQRGMMTHFSSPARFRQIAVGRGRASGGSGRG